ncbi:MAG: hypothetical protein WDO74_11895 [Pseudomonadota bacterium]
MPITVSCTACNSRFSLSDDLYRRRVAGSLVKVKCRNCNAEIAVDATEPVTMPSHEAPRKHPIPPRPKAVTQLGLGAPPPPAELATSSPLPLNPTHSPLPLNATITPLPTNAASGASPAPADAEAIWSDEETIAINTKAKPPRPPVARAVGSAATEEPELVEAEEIPVSSSDAPTLDALTLEAGGAHVPHGKPAPDEFLVSLSAGNDGMVGAPTIDVTSFAAELNPPSVEVALEEDELEYRPARAGTVPLFDMSAVLPVASADGGSGSAIPSALEPGKSADPQFSEGRSRERKFVIAPQAAATATLAPKSRRSSALLWVGLLAAAAAAVAVVGFRGLRWTRAVSNEPALVGAAPPAATPVVNTEAALPAEAPAADTRESASSAPTATAPADQNVTAATRSAAPSNMAALKSSTNTTSSETEKPSSVAEPAVEKPVVAVKSVEAHNSPAPAAPDTEFDRAAARNALAAAAAQASSCRKQGDPSGTANLTIVFAPSGRVTTAQIQGPPFSGTPTGGCIASTMRRASVPAFSGDFVTVSKTIVVQ